MEGGRRVAQEASGKGREWMVEQLGALIHCLLAGLRRVGFSSSWEKPSRGSRLSWSNQTAWLVHCNNNCKQKEARRPAQ